LATVLTFDDLPVGSLPSYRFRGGTLSGSGAKEDTTLVGEYAQPAGDATEFFTVSYLYPSGAVNLVFNNPENCFGLYCNRYIEFNFGTDLNDEVILSTADFGFEVDNAFGDPPSPISEPDTRMILGSSLFGLALVRRRRFR